MESGQLVVGWVQTQSLKLHGKTKKGLKKYRVLPLSRRYPPVLVPLRYSGPETYLVFKVTSLPPEGDKRTMPVGEAVRLLKPTEFELAFLYKHGLHTLKHPLPVRTQRDATEDNRRIRYGNAVAVDPVGSKDFDDAISLDKESKLVHVHIADASAWLNTSRRIDPTADRTASLYLPSGVRNMLPDAVSEHAASLVADGVPRPAITVTFRLSTCLEFVRVEESFVTVAHNVCYDKACTNETVRALCSSLDSDAHDMVAQLMVSANAAVAMFLLEHGGVPFPLRVQAEEGAAAEYTCDVLPHAGFPQFRAYTHFTSPIRRYSDMLVHTQLKRVLRGETPLMREVIENALTVVNAHERAARRVYRDVAEHELIEAARDALHDGLPLPPGSVTLFSDGPDDFVTYAVEWNERRVFVTQTARVNLADSEGGSLALVLGSRNRLRLITT